MQADEKRRREPWPWIVGSMLVAMMLVAISFAWVAHRIPDPVVVDESFEAEGGRTGFHPRLVDPPPDARSQEGV